MFSVANAFEFSSSQLDYFQQSIEHYTQRLETAVGSEANRCRLNRGMCYLMLGISRLSLDLLKAALSDFNIVLCSPVITLEDRQLVNNNIRIAENAFLLMEG